MKLNKTLLILALLIFSLTSNAQLNNFDLSKYKLPNLERRSLETNFSLWGQNNYTRPGSNTNSTSNSYRSNLSLDYNHYINNTATQRETNCGLFFHYDYRNYKGEMIDESNPFEPTMYHYNGKDISLNPILYYQMDNREYNEKNNYFENDILLTYEFDQIKSYDSDEFSYDNYNVKINNLLVSLPLKVGSGRIEQVQDARQAVYLFDELAKIDRVSSDKTDEGILKFAELISTLKNKRFFDSRIRRMSELESIDSFLVANGYLLKSDARYFTTLADFWDYGNRPIRNSGTRIAAVLLPQYNFNGYNNSDDSYQYESGKYNVNLYLINLGFELIHEKPINLYWQNTINWSGSGGIIEGNINDKITDTRTDLRIPNIQMAYSQTIGFYPNTRTDMSFTYSLQFAQVFDKTNVEKEIVGVEGIGLKAATGLSINYYVSPKFRINATSSFYYVWQNSADQLVFNFDNIAGSSFITDNFSSQLNHYSKPFYEREMRNYFSISLLYTFF